MSRNIFLIAEIGINHNGDLDITKQLIDVAADAGADAVKFQKRNIDLVYEKAFLDSPRESAWGTTQREQKEGLEFGVDEFREIDRYCKEKKIQWFASAWDLDSVKFLRQFDLQYNKIASAMIVYEELMREVASEKKHTFISTGMSDYPEIELWNTNIDAQMMWLTKNPETYGVIVAGNMFGDIISDGFAGLIGGLGFACSAQMNPETGIAVFEPTHGSAPKYADYETSIEILAM